MYQFGKPGEDNKEKGSDYMLGFTTTGYHYGLTRQAEIDRGIAGSDSVSDYKYAQFFDDIFAVSFVWKPYIYVHGGILVNNEIEPNDDGTMSYFNSSGISTRWFVASNILSFLDTNFVLKESEVESMGAEVALKKMYAYINQASGHRT